jgi:hypothetical protein
VKPTEFHPDAAQEANDAVDYYDGLRPGLGDDFRAELEFQAIYAAAARGVPGRSRYRSKPAT